MREFAGRSRSNLRIPFVSFAGRDNAGGSATGPQTLQGFTALNTANAKLMLNNVILGVSSEHMMIDGNSTKHGTGANGTAFKTPTGISAASRVKSQAFLVAAMLAALYGINVSTDNFWGDGGWGTPPSNLATVDPRITLIGTPVISSSQMGPGGNALAATNTTTGFTFTTAKQFDSITVFYAYSGGNMTVTGDVDTTPHPTSKTTANIVLSEKISFTGLQNSVSFKGATASGFRLYGCYVENSTIGKVLHVHNGGWVGSTTANWASTTALKNPSECINLLNPRVVMFGEDINDPIGGVSPATHQANLQTFFTAVKTATCDPILYTDHWCASSDVDGYGSGVPLANLQASYAASIAAAVAMGIPQANTHVYYGSYAAQLAKGYMWDEKHMLSISAGATVGQFDEAAHMIVPAIQAAYTAGVTSPFQNVQSMAAWQAKRAAVVAQSARTTVIFAGDSARASYFGDNVANFQAIHAQDARIAKAFASIGVPTTYNAGFGGHGVTALSNWDFRFAQGAWPYQSGFGISAGGEFFMVGSAATATLTPQDDTTTPIATDSCDIYYAQDPSQGGLNGQVDSAATVPINQNNALSKVTKTTITATLGNHTWKAIWSSGTANWIGMFAYNSAIKAIDFWNLAAISTLATQWADTTYAWNPGNMWSAFPTALIFFSAGANDFINGATLATTLPFIVSAIQKMQAAGHTVIVMGYPPIDTAVLSAAQQDQLNATMLQAAQQTGCQFYDLLNRLGGSSAYAANNTAGIMGNNEHLNYKGYTTPVQDLYALLSA